MPGDNAAPFCLSSRMFSRIRTLGSGLALLCLSAFAGAEPKALPADVIPPAAKPVALPGPPLKALTAAEIAAADKTDALSVPTPGELMTALNKLGKPDWPSLFRPVIPTTFPSRPQMALNLGGLIADGYIAIEAENPQQLKNVGKDIIALTKPLSVQQDIINRGNSLTQFADAKQWDVLREELEATQNEVKNAMGQNQDQSLITLVTVGGWARGTEAITGYLARNYTEAGAKIIRQPAIIKMLNQRLDELPDKVRDDPAVKTTRVKLIEMTDAVSFSRTTTPTVEDLKQLNKLALELMQGITTKPKK